MGNISYQVGKTNQTTYCLTVTKKRVILLDETYNEQFQIPFLDILISLNTGDIQSLFVNFVTKKLDIQTIFEKKDVINSFFYILTLFIDDKYNKNKIDDYNRYYDTIIPLELTSIDEYDNVLKDYIKYLGREYNECNIKISVSISGILHLISKDYIRKIENEIFDSIINDCLTVIKELYTQFNKYSSLFYNKCFNKVVNDNPMKRQFLDIQFQNIYPNSEKKSNPLIDKILIKNPDLKKPNIIQQCGTPLVKYLWRLVNRSNHEWEVFCFLNENVFCNKSNGFYYIINLKSSILTKNTYFFNLSSCHTFTNDNYDHITLLDINTPFVKQVLINNMSIPEDTDIFLELKNFEDENSINQNIEYVPVLNEDRIPCLIDLDLFSKFEIDSKLIYRKEDIIKEICSKIDTINNFTEETLQQRFISGYLERSYLESDFTKDSNRIGEINYRLKKNFHFVKTQSYFFHQLFHRYQKDIFIISGSHQFVIPNTKEQENFELGRRTEWVVDRFLKNYIESDKWYCTIDEEFSENRITHYPGYPFLFDTIPLCETIWNNQSGESFKPYDFSITFRNVEYKIEVKSTRGDEENIFYISVKELEELLKDPDRYFILRLSYIQKFEMYFGIQFNDEFYGRFYKIKPETIKLVIKKLPEWKEYDKTNTIRFTVDQFELIPDTYIGESEPDRYPHPNILNSKYWKKYGEFVQRTYFDDLERILNTYSEFPEVSKLKEDFLVLKMGHKFHFVENLIKEEFVFPNEVEDITVDNVVLPPKSFNSSPVEDDLPF